MASSNTIGVSVAGDIRNIISANRVGVQIEGHGTDSNTVAGNYIGLKVNGVEALPNTQEGVLIMGGHRDNIIGTDGSGTSDEAERNVISGNIGNGVKITGGMTDGNVVAGNYIGLKANGLEGLGNGDNGVLIEGLAEMNIIGADGDGSVGEAGEGNIISANNGAGVMIKDGGTRNNEVRGNNIGSDITQMFSFPNANGLIIEESAAQNQAQGNYIRGNQGDGVLIRTGTTDNLIGTDGDGQNDADEGNMIFENGGNGIEITGAGTALNIIAGNMVGMAGSPNGQNGVLISASASENTVGTDGRGAGKADEGNIIAGNTGNGVMITGDGTSGNVIAGNTVGFAGFTNGENGVLIAGGASLNVVGTDGNGVGDDAERNIIDNNIGDGVQISGPTTWHNKVAGNTIGTPGVGNWEAGVLISNGAFGNIIGVDGDRSAGEANEYNVISSNWASGVEINGAGGNRVAGNYIGTDTQGNMQGNVDYGVLIDGAASSNIVGSDFDGQSDWLEGNAIAYNGLDGVRVAGFAGCENNSIRGNAITDNVGLGIDLAPLGIGGPTPNDPLDMDGGPNGLQNCPLIGHIELGSIAMVEWVLNSTPNTKFNIDVYGNFDHDPSGFGEGWWYLDTVELETDEFGNGHKIWTSHSGFGNFSATATAVGNGSTSEFSPFPGTLGYGSVDLDIDSDNPYSPDPMNFDGPARSLAEDGIEANPELPGKRIDVTIRDSDSDDIPNYADGYDLRGSETEDDDVATNLQFVPIVLEYSGSMNPADAIFTISYSSSDPLGVTYDGAYSPAPGAMRVWRQDGRRCASRSDRLYRSGGLLRVATGLWAYGDRADVVRRRCKCYGMHGGKADQRGGPVNGRLDGCVCKQDEVFITNEEPVDESFIAGYVFYDRNANALWDTLEVGKDDAGVVFVIDVSGRRSLGF